MSSSSGRRFRSKTDLWLILVLTIPILLGLYPAVLAAAEGLFWVPLLVLLPLGLLAWGIASTEYVVTDDLLVARSLWLRYRIPTDAIRTLRASRNPLSAPAMSLDRIEVTHVGGRLLTSPRNRAGFVAAVLAANPSIAVAGLPTGGAPAPIAPAEPEEGINPLFPFLLVIFVPLLLVVGLLFYSDTRPTEAQVTDGQLIVTGNFGISVDIEEITAITLEPTMPRPRRRLRGFSLGGTRRGRFLVDSLGEGMLYTVADRPPYLIIQTTDSFVILNAEAASDTQRLHDLLMAAWQAR